MEGVSSREMLDKSIEDFIFKQYALPMDFEIDDGLRKLQAVQLLQNNDALLMAIPINDALTSLNKQWEALMLVDLLLTNMTFRTANLGDVSALLTLVNSAYQPISGYGGWTDETRFVRGTRINVMGLEKLLLADNSVVIVKLAARHDHRLRALRKNLKPCASRYAGS